MSLTLAATDHVLAQPGHIFWVKQDYYLKLPHGDPRTANTDVKNNSCAQWGDSRTKGHHGLVLSEWPIHTVLDLVCVHISGSDDPRAWPFPVAHRRDFGVPSLKNRRSTTDRVADQWRHKTQMRAHGRSSQTFNPRDCRSSYRTCPLTGHNACSHQFPCGAVNWSLPWQLVPVVRPA